jgi:MFS family permease
VNSDNLRESIWTPLKLPLYRAMWIGICLSNLGYWMQSTTASWLMKEWSDGDPFLVSLVQTAYFLPTVILIVFAGTLADIFNRKHLLILANLWMMTSAALLAIIIYQGSTNPLILLLLSALLAIGFALNQPTQSAIVPEIVGIKNIGPAVSLYSIANNGARVLGPAIAGILIPIISGAAVIAMNAGSYLLLLGVLFFWKRISSPPRKKTIKFFTLLLEGFSFVRKSSSFCTLIIRGGVFFGVTSIVMAMMPMLVTNVEQYGLIFGCFGLGAIIGAVNYASLSNKFSRNTIVTVSILIHGIALILLGIVKNAVAMSLILLVVGTAWFFVMSALQISAQLLLPDEMRGRGIAILNMTLMSGYAIGSPIWGITALVTSPSLSMIIAGLISLLCLFITRHLAFPANK